MMVHLCLSVHPCRRRRARAEDGTSGEWRTKRKIYLYEPCAFHFSLAIAIPHRRRWPGFWPGPASTNLPSFPPSPPPLSPLQVRPCTIIRQEWWFGLPYSIIMYARSQRNSLLIHVFGRARRCGGLTTMYHCLPVSLHARAYTYIIHLYISLFIYIYSKQRRGYRIANNSVGHIYV